MAKKTNKTSHVMDLLTNGASGEVNEPAESASAAPDTAAGQEKKSDVQSHTVSPKKVTVVDESSRNDRLSQEILNKLSEELESDAAGQDTAVQMEESAAPAAPEPAPTPEAAAPVAEESSPVADIPAAMEAIAAEAPTTVSEAPATETSADASPETPAAEMTAEASEPAGPLPEDAASGTKASVQSIIPKSQLGERLSRNDHHFVNVMELLLLRQDLDSFLDQYNVCKCDRCMADVCALVLTGLPAKYVVTSKDSVSPILGYYESKYKIYMLTELIKACNKVREHPRH